MPSHLLPVSSVPPTTFVPTSLYDRFVPHEGPMGVRGRNSDNTMIREKLGWAPMISIRSGLEVTYRWIKTQVEADAAQGIDVSLYGSSKV